MPHKPIPKIAISSDKTRLDIEFLHSELSQKYWAKGIPRKVLDASIANSMCFGVYLHDTQLQIGFARIISDYATFAYLADVFIQEDYQGLGYAKRLMEEIKSAPELQNLRRWMLITRDAHTLYQQFGFILLAHPDRVMEITKPTIYQT